MSDGPKKEFWVYQSAVPSEDDTVVLYGSVFRVTGILWMLGVPMYDEYTLSTLPPKEFLTKREADLHVVVISLKYESDMP